MKKSQKKKKKNLPAANFFSQKLAWKQLPWQLLLFMLFLFFFTLLSKINNYYDYACMIQQLLSIIRCDVGERGFGLIYK